MGREGRRLRALALGAALALGPGAALVPAAAMAQAPRLGAPVLDPAGWGRWVARWDSLPAWARGIVLPPLTRADSLGLWRSAVSRPHLRDVALHRLAMLHLAAGDTARADSCWALVAAERTPWAWPALRGRAEIALARGAAVDADSLLERADRSGWTEAERASWLALRVRARAVAGDTAQAIEFARQALRVYPSLPAAAQSLVRLEGLLAARGGSLSVADERAAAEVDVFRGRAASAVERLQRVVANPAAGLERREAGLRLCEVLRTARRFSDARAAVATLAALPMPGGAGLLTLERARIERDAGRPDSALALYAAFAAGEANGGRLAGWEAGRTAEGAGRWEEARGWYVQAAQGDGRRGADAAFRAGLMHFVGGRADSAAACWAPDSCDAARFWYGVARRGLGDRAAGDSVLRRVAVLPGYSFYRAAARDTLGMRGWPARLTPAPAPARDSCPAIGAAGDLAAIGVSEEALALLSRVSARGGLTGADAPGCDPVEEALSGACLAYALGRPGLGIALAERAIRWNDPDLRDTAAWSLIPWAFPPAYESLLAAPPGAVAAALEPALLFAVVHQESRFDPRARSRSDALGLMQLKLATAQDVARRAREPAPRESTLFDPEKNVRYGAHYLQWLLRRFDGSVAAALSAYNAGPSTVSKRWRELRERGGEALVCELASNPLAQDYTKRILAYRQAYRELRPTAGR